MSTIFFLFALYSNQNADALPVQNLTALPTEFSTSWVADPSGRGTWTLLYSCVFTLALCAWTSLHLNVPPPNEAAAKRWLREAKWVLIALFAPEVVALCAVQQWTAARSLLAALAALEEGINNEAALSESPNNRVQKSKSNLRSRFDMRYAYFVNMGGIAVDISHLHNTLDRATIPAEGVRFLAKLGHYIQPSNEAIQSRARSDYLARGLVALQVFWICGQAIERKVSGYPLTLLEIHTLSQAVCAIIIYALWIPKPLNVQDPISIDSYNIQEPLAFMLLKTNFRHHPGHQKKPFAGYRYFHSRDLGWYGHLDRCYLRTSMETRLPSELFCNIKLSFGQSSKTQRETFFKTVLNTDDGARQDYTFNTIDGVIVPETSTDTICTLVSGQALSSGLGPIEKAESNWPGLLLSLSSKDVRAFDLAGSFIRNQLQDLPDLPTHNPIELNEVNRMICDKMSFPILRRGLSFREANFQSLNGLKEFAVWAAISLMPAIYGGLHLSGLTVTFPTPMEKLLWEISSFALIGIAAIFGLSTLVIFVGRDLELHSGFRRKLSQVILWIPRFFTNLSDEIVAIVFILFLAFLGLIYISARFYLVIESFISLRHVPVGVYETPERNVMAYVPHL